MRWLVGAENESGCVRINVDKIETIESEISSEWGGEGYTFCKFHAICGNRKLGICSVRIISGAPFSENEFFEKIRMTLDNLKDGEIIDLQHLFLKPIKIRPKKLRPEKMKPVIF
jgi:hypothetical protein